MKVLQFFIEWSVSGAHVCLAAPATDVNGIVAAADDDDAACAVRETEVMMMMMMMTILSKPKYTPGWRRLADLQLALEGVEGVAGDAAEGNGGGGGGGVGCYSGGGGVGWCGGGGGGGLRMRRGAWRWQRVWVGGGRHVKQRGLLLQQLGLKEGWLYTAANVLYRLAAREMFARDVVKTRRCCCGGASTAATHVLFKWQHLFAWMKSLNVPAWRVTARESCGWHMSHDTLGETFIWFRKDRNAGRGGLKQKTVTEFLQD